MTTNLNAGDAYFNDVIKRGDEASGSFLDACKEGNKKSIAHHFKILHPDGSINIDNQPNNMHISKIKAVKETIDGVGTKVQIYTNQFENIFQSRKNNEIDGDEARKQATELWERMLMDLIAMNADDLRGGELAIGATNIIDINHLKGARGHLFQDSMAAAMKEVIKTTEIAMLAGETAVLGISPEANKLHTITQDALERIENILKYDRKDDTPSKINKHIQSIIDILQVHTKVKLEEISFNIGGTCTGLATEQDKLIPLENGQVIIGFQEKRVNGIIGPRSNGITKIREDMKTIMGDGRENKTFEDFLANIGPEKSAKIPEEVKDICKSKKMRDIATGKTTVFNPFIADCLLGGLEFEPQVGISALIHVTGNPLKKISEGVNRNKEEKYMVNIDMSDMPTPHIITLLQAALDIPDEQAINKRNMGVPYAVVCNPKDINSIIEKAGFFSITAKVIGTIKKPETHLIHKIAGEKNTIIGVGLNKSSIEF